MCRGGGGFVLTQTAFAFFLDFPRVLLGFTISNTLVPQQAEAAFFFIRAHDTNGDQLRQHTGILDKLAII